MISAQEIISYAHISESLQYRLYITYLFYCSIRRDIIWLRYCRYFRCNQFSHQLFSPISGRNGWAVSSVVVGCVVGSFSSGYLSKRFGRKKSLMISALLFTISAVGTSLSYTFLHFIIYRIVGGLAVGLAATVSPMYMSEVSPKDMRGRALSMQQFAIVFGQILIFYVNYKIASIATNTWLIEIGWRYMFAAGIAPCILFCILVFFIPESPAG